MTGARQGRVAVGLHGAVLRDHVRSGALLLLLVVEVAVAAYVARVAGLVRAWFLSDSRAVRFTAWNWWSTAASSRFVRYALPGGPVGAGLFAVDRLAIRGLGLGYPRLARWSVLALGGLGGLFALAGRAYLALTHPYM